MTLRWPATESDVDPPETVVYFRVHSFFFNVERGTVRLLRLLYRNSAALGIVHWNTPLISPKVRSCALYVLGAIGAKCLWAKLLRGLNRGTGFESLPNCGDVATFCFPAGARVFDLETKRIVNVYQPSNDEDSRRLERVIRDQERLGELGLAPKILQRHAPGGGYVEEMCDGAPLKTLAWWNADIFRRVAARAEMIQQAEHPADRRPTEVAVELSDTLDRVGSLYSGMRDSIGFAWLTDQVEDTCRRIARNQAQHAFLSHGDLARRNILMRRDGELVFIDWHTVGHRLTDYDIYNYHFSIIQDGCADRISESLVFEYLSEALKRPSGEQSAGQLLTFKLEFFLTRLKCFLLPGPPDRSRADKVLRQLQEYADCFARYETWISAAGKGASH